MIPSFTPAPPSSGEAHHVGRLPWLPLLGLSAWYIAHVWFPAHRELWYDELLTYYIARMPTLGQLLNALRQIDLNPPPEYLLVRLSMFLFGNSEAAVRLPSMLAFYGGSMFLFFYLRRKVGDAFACFGVALLWFSDVFYLAAEARSYGLVLLFFSALLLCWDTAVTAERRTAALWGAGVANACLLVSHGFAPLSLPPFLAAEAVRFLRRRKADYALWAALVLPMAVMAIYIPLYRDYSGCLFPAAFQASLLQIAKFYAHTIKQAGVGVLLLLGAAWLTRASVRKVNERPAFGPVEFALFAVLSLNPVLANLALMKTHGAFWPRYCMTTSAALFGGFAVWIAPRLRFNRNAAYAAAWGLAAISLVVDTILPAIRGRQQDSIAEIQPGLPLVAASGLTYLEMDHYESATLVSRLFYLEDRPAAVRYAHATLFEDLEGMDKLKRFFPIRANVQSYSQFIREHRQFVVLGTWDYPEDWLLKKLHDDGAIAGTIGEYRLPYKDKTFYLVTLPAALTTP